jgi:hypothetical protein
MNTWWSPAATRREARPSRRADPLLLPTCRLATVLQDQQYALELRLTNFGFALVISGGDGLGVTLRNVTVTPETLAEVPRHEWSRLVSPTAFYQSYDWLLGQQSWADARGSRPRR